MLIYTIKRYMFQLLVGCRFIYSLVYEEKIETFMQDLIFYLWTNLSFCKTRNKKKGLNINLFQINFLTYPITFICLYHLSIYHNITLV
jgi:hypothetical protein